MTTRDEVAQKLAECDGHVWAALSDEDGFDGSLPFKQQITYRGRGHYRFMADTIMPLLNRAERTVGSVEVCSVCKQPIDGYRPDLCWRNVFTSPDTPCPIRSGAKA